LNQGKMRLKKELILLRVERLVLFLSRTRESLVLFIRPERTKQIGLKRVVCLSELALPPFRF